MRWATLAMFVAGCGRIAFDDRIVAAADDGDIEAALEADAFACSSGHDEDVDGIDDCSDVCPHIPDPGQLDTDGDHVGDLCDPEVTIPRQRIMFFDGFSSLANWTSPSATIVGDELVLDARGGQAREAVRSLVPAIDRFEVALTTSGAGAGQYAFAIVTAPASPPGGYYCEMYDDGTQTSTMFTWTYDNSNYMHSGVSMWTQPLNAGTGTLTYDHGAGTTSCNSVWNGDARGGGGTIPSGITPVSLHLYAENVVVSIAYMIQIRTE